MYELLGVQDYDFTDSSGKRLIGSTLYFTDSNEKRGLRGCSSFKIKCPNCVNPLELVIGSLFNLIFDRNGHLVSLSEA